MQITQGKLSLTPQKSVKIVKNLKFRPLSTIQLFFKTHFFDRKKPTESENVKNGTPSGPVLENTDRNLPGYTESNFLLFTIDKLFILFFKH